MSRKMLINAQRPEELRLAIVDGSTLETYQVETAEAGLTRGNIYRGVIVNIQPSLNAAFIDYGAERHGFLAIQDVVEEAWYRQPEGGGRPRIEQVLEKGKPIVVQVSRDPEGSKGAALTTNLSFAGRYLVLTPFDAMRGVSRKVEDEDTRKKLKELVGKLTMPTGCGVIVRTNALDQNRTALNRDLNALLRLWKRVQGEARQGRGPRLLYSDQDLLLRALRDYLDSSAEVVVVDHPAAHEKVLQYMQAFMPRAKTELQLYTERMPLFSRHDLERQINQIDQRVVSLPSGGSIVIDRTEALTAIDVNSGRSTRGASQEETAVATNLEAAVEVARQLRLRDLGGLVVVDFIDMRASKYQKRVEKEMRDAMKLDRARSSVGHLSSNGLLEVNRQRLQQALAVRTQRTCPACGGSGRIPNADQAELSLLRRLEARAAQGDLQRVRVLLHPELSESFQNNRRRELAALETELDLRIQISASPSLNRSEEEIHWTRREGVAAISPPREAPVSARDLAVRQATVAAPPSEPAAASDEAEATSGPAKKGRKRRRSRRRRGANGSSPTAANETSSEATVAREPTDGPISDAEEVAPEPLEAASSRPKRKRSRDEKSDAGQSGEPDDEPTAAGERPIPEDLENWPSGDGDDATAPLVTAEGTRGKRRRPRRRRRKAEGESSEGSDSGSADGAAAVEALSDRPIDTAADAELAIGTPDAPAD